MKKKDIITIVISMIFIIGAAFFGYKLLFPKKASNTSQDQKQKQQQEQKFTGNIDETMLEKVNSLQDYGEASLDNIGRANPFGPL
ncbi:MAG: hypothetical protein NTZ85_01745 [Bacteroidia bacterium]|jgi:flagellar basal body-associated protein FliL|nr:hypothetical protein [Bacteroidia bacterium]